MSPRAAAGSPSEQARASSTAAPSRCSPSHRRAASSATGVTDSAHRPLEGDEHTLDATTAKPALDVHGGDGTQLPALLCVLVQHLLQLVTGHLAAEHALTKFHDLVLVPTRHVPGSPRLRGQPAW